MWGDDPVKLRDHAKKMEDGDETYYDYQWWHVVDMMNSEILFKVD